MGKESIRGKLYKAIDGLRVHLGAFEPRRPRRIPEVAEEPEPSVAMASALQIRDLFTVIEQTIEAKVLNVSISSGGKQIGVSKRPTGEVAYMEHLAKDDPNTRIRIETDGVTVVRIKINKYSDSPQVSQEVTSGEIGNFIEEARKIRDPFGKLKA